jgi:3-hydroxyisobutyrate dehydrogenase-like beta-hydroxyacid dehydrogenase
MNETSTVSLLGLGHMGHALGAALVSAGISPTVWNRTSGKATDLIAGGAMEAKNPRDAIENAELVVVCLLDHASVQENLAPVVDALRGRTLVNLTTTSPEEARELGRWAEAGGIEYLDGGIMAVPSMIATPASEIFYSGDESAFDRFRPILDLWGKSSFFGRDPGLASLHDLALLSSMYVMFAGYMQGAALVATAGVSATDFAARAAAWISAMTGELAEYGRVIDGGDYSVPGQQSLDFSDLSTMLAAADDMGVGSGPIRMVQELIDTQRAAGHGGDALARIFESLARRTPTHASDDSK